MDTATTINMAANNGVVSMSYSLNSTKSQAYIAIARGGASRGYEIYILNCTTGILSQLKSNNIATSMTPIGTLSPDIYVTWENNFTQIRNVDLDIESTINATGLIGDGIVATHNFPVNSGITRGGLPYVCSTMNGVEGSFSIFPVCAMSILLPSGKILGINNVTPWMGAQLTTAILKTAIAGYGRLYAGGATTNYRYNFAWNGGNIIDNYATSMSVLGSPQAQSYCGGNGETTMRFLVSSNVNNYRLSTVDITAPIRGVRSCPQNAPIFGSIGFATANIPAGGTGNVIISYNASIAAGVGC